MVKAIPWIAPACSKEPSQVDGLRQWMRWLWERVDPAVALVLAIVFSALGALGVASSGVLANAVLATLAIIAFTLLRERSGRESVQATSRELKSSVDMVTDALAQLRGDVGTVGTDVKQVDKFLAELDTLIQPVQPHLVGTLFDKAMLDTDRWIYKGGTGTYLRAVTIPRNAENARRDKNRRQISIEVIDPTNVPVCERYGRYRRKVGTQDPYGEEWTTERVRCESYAAIIAAAYYQDTADWLNVRIGLSSTMTIFRYDMSSSYLIITQEDPRQPALKAGTNSLFYRLWSEELALSFEQSNQLDLTKVARMDLAEINQAKASALLHTLGVPLDPSLSGLLDEIIEKALRARDPYPK
jgi:hypothetical protein